MAIDKTIKKKINEDWQAAFPQLSLYEQNKLYKVAGSVIIGLELIKSPFSDSYSPYFVVYPLFGNKMGTDIKACLSGPIILKDFKNKKGFQYEIPYEKHEMFFKDVVDRIREQILLPFDGNIYLKNLMYLFDEYSQTPPLSAAPNSYLQAALIEAKLKIALSISNEEAQSVIQQIKVRSWDVLHFKAFGVDVNEWLQNLEEILTNRDGLLKQIEANKQDRKIAKLQSSELTV